MFIDLHILSSTPCNSVNEIFFFHNAKQWPLGLFLPRELILWWLVIVFVFSYMVWTLKTWLKVEMVIVAYYNTKRSRVQILLQANFEN